MVNKNIKMFAVKFLKSSGAYTVGEIAGFPEEVAHRMIQDEVAVKYSPTKEEDKIAKLRNRPMGEDKQALQDRDTDYVTK